MGADAALEPVEDRAQQQGALHVPEAAFGLEQILVAQGRVLGADVRVAGGQQVLAVQPRLRLDLGAVDDQPPVALLADPAAEGGLITQLAFGLDVRGLGPVMGLGAVALAVGADTGQFRLDAGDRGLALAWSRWAWSGL